MTGVRAIGTAIAATALFSLFCFAASPASAFQGIDTFTTSTTTTQAGGHPDLGTSFRLNSPGSPEAAKNVTFNAPEGLFGNPSSATRCQASDYALQQCPPNSQVGLATIYAKGAGMPDDLLGTAPIFNLEPGEDQTALFALIVPSLGIPIKIPVAVRTGSDYGLRFTVANLSQLYPLAGADLTFWGFPAEEANDDQRFPKGTPGSPTGCPGLADASCITTPTKASIAPQPLTANPTICTEEPLVTTLVVQTYQDPANPTEAQSGYPATTDCYAQTFAPVMRGRPTTTETDAPSGLDLQLSSKQFLTRAVAPSQIRNATVVLPAGLTINPDAADGQGACTDQQASFGTESAANCPDASKIGTFSINTVALEEPLGGSLFIGEPKPGNQYRVFMVADGFGVHVKLEGKLLPDPQTGQLTAIFEDLPQVPFDNFELHLFASDRGLMATPTHCSTYEVKATFDPWNDKLAPQSSNQFFGLTQGPGGSPCPDQVRPFEPRLLAGTSNPNAGAFSSFTLKLDRDDGDQFIADLGFEMPPGFTGSLRGISYCPEAAISSAALKLGRTEQAIPSCPASSAVGTSNVAAGPGTHPFHALGNVYMAGPFKGAPLSLVVITPALAGPYDYGTVVVRVAIHVDPKDAHVRAISDSVPQVIGGIPLRMRSIQVNLDRPNFIVNPTNCEPMSVASKGIGDQGTTANFSSYFNAVNCATLPFRPKMTITQLGGKKQTKRSKNPSLRFELKTRPGDANLKSVAVTLPKAFAIDQEHLGNICSKAELAKNQCQGRQPIGYASTSTPLLDQPLSGPAYAVSGFGKLPHLAFILAGQVTIVPEAISSSVKGGHLRTVVPVIPDAPVGTFTLTLFGQRQGYLENTRSLCARAAITEVQFQGQNGKELTQKVKAKTACGSKGKAKRPQR
jgi:hypothetical protein